MLSKTGGTCTSVKKKNEICLRNDETNWCVKMRMCKKVDNYKENSKRTQGSKRGHGIWPLMWLYETQHAAVLVTVLISQSSPTAPVLFSPYPKQACHYKQWPSAISGTPCNICIFQLLNLHQYTHIHSRITAGCISMQNMAYVNYFYSIKFSLSHDKQMHPHLTELWSGQVRSNSIQSSVTKAA